MICLKDLDAITNIPLPSDTIKITLGINFFTNKASLKGLVIEKWENGNHLYTKWEYIFAVLEKHSLLLKNAHAHSPSH